MPRQTTVSDEQEKKVPRVDLQIGEHPDPPGLSHPVLPIILLLLPCYACIFSDFLYSKVLTGCFCCGYGIAFSHGVPLLAEKLDRSRNGYRKWQFGNFVQLHPLSYISYYHMIAIR